MLRKKSILVSILAIFWLVYVGFSVSTFMASNESSVEQWYNKRKVEASAILDTSADLLASNQFNTLEKYLVRSHKLKLYEFAVVSKNNQPILSINKDQVLYGADPGTNANYPVTRDFVDIDGFIFKAIEVVRPDGKYKLTIGMIKLASGERISDLWKMKYWFLFDITMVTSLLAFILFLVLRDLIKVASAIERNDFDSVAKVKAQSRESGFLISFSRTLKKQGERLKAEKDLLKHAVGPAFVKDAVELSQTQSVAKKHRVMVMMDWNNHTELMHKHGIDKIDQIRNRMFLMMDTLIMRYQGLRLESAGDSLTFCFENVNPLRAKRLALSCVRAIFLDLERQELREPEIPLKYKAALIEGEFQLKKTLVDYKMSSTTWYEAARALSQVKDKSKSSLVLMSKDQEGLSDLADFSQAVEVQFKGFPEPVMVCQVSHFKSFSEYATEQGFERLSSQADFELFADDRELLQALDFVLSQSQEAQVMLGLENLKKIRIYRYLSGLLIPKQFEQHLDRLVAEKISVQILSSFIGLLPALVTRQKVSEDLWPKLRNLTQHPNSRVVANALDALRKLTDDHTLFEPFLKANNSRIRGIALIAEGERLVDATLTKHIKELYESQEAAAICTALYVDCALYQFHSEVNETYLATNDYLSEIPNKIDQFLSSSHEAVRRRALISKKEILGMALGQAV